MTFMEIPRVTLPTKCLQSLIKSVLQYTFANIFLFILTDSQKQSSNLSLLMLTLIHFDGFTFACSGAVLQRNFSRSTACFIENHQLRQCFHSTFYNTSSENHFRYRIKKNKLLQQIFLLLWMFFTDFNRQRGEIGVSQQGRYHFRSTKNIKLQLSFQN